MVGTKVFNYVKSYALMLNNKQTDFEVTFSEEDLSFKYKGSDEYVNLNFAFKITDDLDVALELLDYAESFDAAANTMKYLDDNGHTKNDMPYNMGGIFSKCVKFQDAVYETHDIANEIDDTSFLQRVDTISVGDRIILADQSGEDEHIVTDTDTSFGVVTMWILGDLGSDTIEEYEDDLVLKNIDGTYYICCD